MVLAVKRFAKKENGFSLIELLAVIVILAVIAAIAIPLLGNLISKTKENAEIATAAKLYEAAKLYALEQGIETVPTTVTLGDLQDGGFLEKNLVNPKTGKELDEDSTEIVFTDGVLTRVTLVDESQSVSYSAEVVIAGKGDPLP